MGRQIGGPVPGRPFKDRLFFFAAQEWVNYFAVQTNSAVVPTAAMRRGDFSELLNPSNRFFNRAITITNPLTGQPFPNNVIPATRLNPVGVKMLSYLPAPTRDVSQAREIRQLADRGMELSGRFGKSRWKEVVPLAIFVSAFCVLVFIVALKQPLPLWGE